MPDVMISYARRDAKLFAGRLSAALHRKGLKAWLDTADVPGGAQWLREISQAVEQCKVFIAVQSQAGSQSEWVLRERLMALDLKKPIIPIFHIERIRDFELIDRQPIDFTDDFEKKLPYLIEQIQHYATPGTPPRETVDQRQLERAYLGRVLAEHKIWQQVYTPMAGVGQIEINTVPATEDDDDEIEIVPTPIDSLFKQLDKRLDANREPAKQTEMQERPFDDILPAVDERRRLVVLGDPGSGKTTTLWRITADYAQRAMDDESAPMPVFVRLGELESGQTLQQAIAASLGDDLAAHLETLIENGRLAFLLDGLNEIESDIEAQTIAAIRTLVSDCTQHDRVVVVTCRELDYIESRKLNIPDEIVITPLDPVRIRRFVNNYISKPAGKGDELFWQLAGGDDVRTTWEKWAEAGANFELFWTAKEIPRENPNVYGIISWQHDSIWQATITDFNADGSRSMLKMAQNPYMLFMMTRVFTLSKRLPDNRGLLFKGFIDYLLIDREQLSEADAEQLKQRLAALAFNMQRQGEGTSVDKAQAMEHLQDEQSLYRARSAHILTGKAQIRFTHQLLQEYFAARKLDQERLNGTPATSIWPPDNWWEPTGWEETAILMAGLYSDDCSPVVAWLRDAQPELAARCVLESGAGIDEATLTTLQNEWLPRLTDIDTYPRPQDRAGFGRGLGLLKLDNRPGVGVIVRDGVTVPDIDWVEIPAGKFIFGDDNKDDYPSYAKPADRQELELDTFYISRYSITYAQFQVFLDAADGINSTEYDWFEGLAADADDRQMRDQYFKYANHPREIVSWYDAMAFCRWLSWRLVRAPYTEPLHNASFDMMNPFTWPVRLPTEQEWEKAARGTQGLIYPYGNEFDAAKGNTREGNNIGQTSAVGMYPQGASPYGVLDMSGNVWEWCLTEYGTGESQDISNTNNRVLRGGSWYYNRDYARSAYRNFKLPYNRDFNVGFRVVCVRPPSLKT
jgi:formylglycine-generating enzyme required for sulfatase activity/GTPase SAR1 family protein